MRRRGRSGAGGRSCPTDPGGGLLPAGAAILPGRLLPGALSGTARLFGEDTDEGAWDFIKEKGRQAVSFIRGAYNVFCGAVILFQLKCFQIRVILFDIHLR